MRKGMGRGRGKGYKNIMGRDPRIHSMSAKGQKQPQRIPHIPTKRLSDIRVQTTQDTAKKLMMGWIPKEQLSIVYYYILEDANFHDLNKKLTAKGLFGSFDVTKYPSGNVYTPNSYGTDYAEKLYRDYIKAGGKTWDIP